MAQLKDTVVQGSLRVTDTTYSTNINSTDITTTDLTLSSGTASQVVKTDSNKKLITSTLSTSDIPDLSSTYLSLSGGTLTGRLTTSKSINQIITGTGSVGVNNGSGDHQYQPSVWTFNTGLTASDGDIFTIKIPAAGHSYGVWMSVDNGTNYYPVNLNGTTRLTTEFPVDTYLQVIFESTGSTAAIYPQDGGKSTSTVTDGSWRVINYRDTNSTYNMYQLTSASGNGRTATSQTGGVGLHRYTLQMMLPDYTWSSIASDYKNAATTNKTTTNKDPATCSFLLHSPIIYQTTNINATAGNTIEADGMTSYAIDFRYNTTNNLWSNLTFQAPVYLVGSVQSDFTFKLDSTKWWTQTLPTTEDGKIYIFLGLAYSATNIYLHTEHPIYYYKSGALRLYTPLPIKDQSSNGALSSTGTDAVTERAVYYGLAPINGTSQTRATGIYAPTSAGTAGQVLESNGSGAPLWVNAPKVRLYKFTISSLAANTIQSFYDSAFFTENCACIANDLSNPESGSLPGPLSWQFYNGQLNFVCPIAITSSITFNFLVMNPPSSGISLSTSNPTVPVA